MDARRVKESLLLGLVAVLTLVGCSVLLGILSFVLYHGLTAINVGFLTQAARNFGSEGGIVFQLVGTVWLVIGVAIVSLPLSLGTATYHAEYMHNDLKQVASTMLFALNGVPSIIFGLFGYIMFCSILKLGVSWVSGVLILTCMILPTVTVSIKETIEGIPVQFRESGLALGLTRWQLIGRVLIPQSLHGIVTGLLLGLARAAGETAPIMFTATTFSGVTIPRSMYEPVSTLPTHILVLAQESLNPAARTNAWGAALVLITIVFTMSLSALIMRLHVNRQRRE